MGIKRALPDLKHADVTDVILAAFYVIYNALGYGFLEKVYRNALVHELKKRGLKAEIEQKILVFYDGVHVGEYFADIVVEDKVIIEVKTAEAIDVAHKAQLLNYLQATRYEVGLVLNFGPKPGIDRKVWSNIKKPFLQSK